VLAVDSSRPSGRPGLYASLIGLSTALGDCLRAGKTIAPASPSPAQSAVKGMSSHATDFVYAESSSSSSSCFSSVILCDRCSKKSIRPDVAGQAAVVGQCVSAKCGVQVRRVVSAPLAEAIATPASPLSYQTTQRKLKQSYSTPGPVRTAMGDCLQAGKPSRCEACQLGRLRLLPSVGR